MIRATIGGILRPTSPDAALNAESKNHRAARLEELKALINTGDYEVQSLAVADRIVEEWSWVPPAISLQSEAGVVELAVLEPSESESVRERSIQWDESSIDLRARQSRTRGNLVRGLPEVGRLFELGRLRERLVRVSRYAHL